MKVIKFIIGAIVSLLLIFSCSNPTLDTGSALDSFERADAQVAFDTSVLQKYDAVALASSDSGELKEGYILLREGVALKISYIRIEGINVYQGDMILQDKDIYATEMEAHLAGKAEGRASVISSRLWTNNTVYYHISPNVHNRQIIMNAIAEIEAATSVRFVSRASGNYVKFIPHASSCYSMVGMVGGAQDLALANWATTNVVVHEIMHSLGVLHEQSRLDRDNHIIVRWQNIQPGTEHNFRKASGSDAHDVGPFDWNSIMLYPSKAFSTNGQPTLVKKDGSTYTVNRGRMSVGDIAGINFLYKGTNPGDKVAPSKPGALSFSNVTSSAVTLSWGASTDNVGVTAYKLYKNGTFSKSVGGTSATISGLASGTTYKFTVSAVDAAGNESARTAALSITTKKSGGPIVFTWQPGFYYYRGNLVSYKGQIYVCTWSHYAYRSWTPDRAIFHWRRK